MNMKRILSAALAVILTLPANRIILHDGPAGTVYAEENDIIGTLNGTVYTSLETLADDLKDDYKGKSVTIEMLCNWNAAGADHFDTRLVIPSECTAVLNMHGYVFNRDRAYRNNSTSDGELICLESGASLVINGCSAEQEKRKEHPLVAVYTSTGKSGRADGSITTYGGTLTGGCSTNGAGGIHVKDNCSLTVNDVTIAGCSSRDGTVWNGFGGGIYIKEDYSTVRLNNSLITGCYADTDGGGIYANQDPTVIELNNTQIDKNYAYECGGGIYLCDERTRVTGSKGAKVTNNQCGKKGGGIYTNDNDISVSGLEITGNRSTDGAGIYAGDESNSFSGLVIKNNIAGERGGGIYISSNKNTITSCEITDNSAGISGGGVYVNKNVREEFSVAGKVIVRENSPHNFYISDSAPEDTRVNFSLTKGSDVRFSYYTTAGKTTLMVTQGKAGDSYKTPNCTQYLTAENSGYHFAFGTASDNRKIYYIKGSDPSGIEPARKLSEPTIVYSDDANNASGRDSLDDTTAGKIGKVGKRGDGDGDYDLVRGFSFHEETDSDVNDSAVVFYYSDAFFDDDPENYNPHLATASLVMAYAGMYLRASQPEDETGNYYYNKHAAARQFMADIGCPDQNIYINDSNEKKPGTDSIGVTIASKEIELFVSGGTEKKILIPIVVRGGGYEQEWASNATLGNALEMNLNGKGGEAKGFSSAADQVESEIDKYIAKYRLEDEIAQGNVIFWISGYSRAGATANLTAKRLVEKYADGSAGRNSKVFAYTCEAPMGGTDDAELLEGDAKSRYYCIHNLVNAVDIVPLVAPQLMGFKRYGVDHYIPGTASGSVITEDVFAQTDFKQGKRRMRGGLNGPLSVTTRRDNAALKVKGGISADQKNTMMTQLRAVDSGIIFDDYFHPMAMDFFPGMKMYENGDYAGNNVEDFIIDFMRFAQEGKFPIFNPNWSQAVSDRDQYSSQIQEALRDTLALVFTMDEEHSAGFVGRASSIMDSIGTVGGDISQLEIYKMIIGQWHARTALEKQYYTTLLWNRLEATGAFDYLSEADAAKMEKNWPSLADFIFRLVDGDYNYEPGSSSYSQGWAKGMDKTMTLVPTFATFANYILQNHYPEVNLAWARTFDSYYENETEEYVVVCSEGDWLDPPSAAGEGMVRTTDEHGNYVSEQADGTLIPGSDRINKLVGDQRIILDVEDLAGEAVYYDLDDVTDPHAHITLASNRVYRGGIDLLSDMHTKSYTLTTYDISYGKRSERAVYNIVLTSAVHKVYLYPSGKEKDADGNIPEPEIYQYRDGDQVTIHAEAPEEKFFRDWSVYVTNSVGHTSGSDLAWVLLGGQEGASKASVTFTLPQTGDLIEAGSTKRYPDSFGLEITARYDKMIGNISVETNSWAPVEGGEHRFASKADLGFDNSSPLMRDYQPLIWSYTDSEGKTVIVPDGAAEAYDDTAYTLTVVIPNDADHQFASELSARYIPWPQKDADRVESITAVRNDADGSAVVTIQFTPTERKDGEEHPRPERTERLRIGIRDLNTGQYDSDYKVLGAEPGGTVTLAAPAADGEVFTGWKINNTSGLILAEGSDPEDRIIKVRVAEDYRSLEGNTADIDVQFIPVIRMAEAEVGEPVGGEPLPGTKKLYITVFNTYEIREDCIDVTWQPDISERQTADYMTPYTVTVKVKKNADDQVMARKVDSDRNPIEGEEYAAVEALYVISEKLQASVNGNTAAVSADKNSISYTFPETKVNVVSVCKPDDISDVPHDMDNEEDILSVLPKTVTILLDNGREISVPVTWNLRPGNHEDHPQLRDSSVWSARAVIDMDALGTVGDKNNVLDTPVEIRVSVLAAETAEAPDSSLETGVYLTDQVTVLMTREEGGTTFYRVNNGEYEEYRGQPIMIRRDDPDLIPEMTVDEEGNETPTGRMVFVLHAYTEKTGKWDSHEVTYGYIFDNKVSVPDGRQLVYNGEEQTGISGRQFFEIISVDGEGLVNADGDAVGRNAGTYTAVIRIKDGFIWNLPDGTTTSGEQTVTFTIAPLEISEAVTVRADGQFKSPDDLKKALRIEPSGTLKPSEDVDYDICYSPVKDGKVTVTVTGKGNYTGTITKTFIVAKDVPDKTIFTITLDLNGGVLDGVSGKVTMQCYEGEVIRLPKPSRNGYTFDYWKGSRYEAGQEYKVMGDHTFTAQWKRSSDKPDGSADTGDTSHLLMWSVLFAVSLSVLAAAMFLLGKRRPTHTD